MWLRDLIGFDETTPEDVRAQITVEGEVMTSSVNGRSFGCGRLETPTLRELRSRVHELGAPPARPTFREIVADVQDLHQSPAHAECLFQVASQFNLLEMTAPSVTPEEGIGIYEFDRTQGPACAIACGGGTLYRNYFVDVDGQVGQSTDRQIDCLSEIGNRLGNTDNQLWAMQNGYALPSPEGLETIHRRLSAVNETELDQIRASLRVGVHWRPEVTLGDAGHVVHQLYASALPVAYLSLSTQLWQPFAQLILEAAYEATALVAAINAAETGNCQAFLTLLGGGAFGNPQEWIFAAIKRMATLELPIGIKFAIVSYGHSNSELVRFLRDELE